jgi:hypothetical protein
MATLRRRKAQLSGQYFTDFARRDRPVEEVALDLIAAGTGHRGELLPGLDALCHATHIKLSGEACHRLDDGGTVRALGQIADEAAVDFDGIERKAAQVAEGGEGSAKIIERDRSGLAAAIETISLSAE